MKGDSRRHGYGLFSCSQLLVASSPEDDHQEPLNYRGEHHLTRNQIAMAQYGCFQRIMKESHRKTGTGSELNPKVV